MSRSLRLFASIVLFGITLGHTDAALAQSIGSASIEGTVADETQAPLPGVSVTITSPALQVGKREAVTDATGRYRFVDLPVGTYAVQSDLSGFRSVRREGVLLTAGFNARIDMDLKIGGLEESITVSGASPIVDVATTQGGGTISSTVYSTLPTQKTYVDIVRLTVGLTDTTPAANAPGAIGLKAIPGYNIYGNTTKYMLMDGLDFNNVPTPDFGTAEQVDVRTYGNTAETQGPGAVINLLIKSGGNAFHGRSQLAFFNDKLQGSNLTEDLKAQGLNVPSTIKLFTDSGSDIGGRIVRDKLWFYGAFRNRASDQGFAGYTETAAPGSPAAFDYITERTTTGKLSWQATQNYQLIGLTQIERTLDRYAVTEALNWPFAIADGRNTSKETSAILAWNTTTYAPQLKATPTNRLVFNAIGGYSGYRALYVRQPEMLNVPASYDINTQLFTGGNSRQRDILSQYWSISGSVTYLAPRGKWGSHEVKTGWRQNRPYGGLGTNTFNGPDGTPGTGNYVQLFDTIAGVPHQPSQLITYNYPFNSDDRNEVTSVYVSDRWEATGRLTFHMGLRWDHFNFFSPEQTKPQGQFGASGTFPEVLKFKGNHVVPRAAVAWDVTGDGKTVVKGGFGLFSLDPTAANLNQNGLVATTYRWRDLNRNGTYQAGEVDLSYSGPDFLSQVTSAGAIYNPAQKVPTANEISASFERELAASTSARVLYLYHGYFNQNDAINPLRPYSAFTVPIRLPDPGPDGIVAPGDPLVTVWDYSAAYRGGAFQGNTVVNRPSGRNDHYHSVDMTFVRRPVGKWGFASGLSLTKSHRWLASAGTPLSPNDEYFPLDETWSWNYKANATYRLPWDIFAGAIYDVRSGVYYQRTYVFRGLPQQGTATVRLEKFGSQQLPSIHQFDLRAGKTLNLYKTSTLELSLDALNVFNLSTPFSATYASGPRHGNVLTYATPVTVRLGAVFAF